MSKVRLGIIGSGNIGSSHIGHITGGRTPEIELTAVADRDPERRLWAKERCASAVIFAEGEELIGSGECDAVLIATPHVQHPELAVAAFRAGRHVLCEKPAGVYTKQVREMDGEAARHPDLAYAMMFNQRTNCVYRKMRELTRSGSLGAIKRVNWIITDWYRPQYYYDSGGWRATWDGEGGGVLLNQCPHNLDLLQWICGMPARVRAFCHEGKWHSIEVEDDVTAYLEYPNGATGVFVTSTADAPGTNRFEITLEGGKLVCENNRLTLWRLAENERTYCKTVRESFPNPPHTVEEIETDGQNPQHVGVLNAFAAHILRGEPLVAHGSEGISGLTLSNAMHLSSWLDRTVEIPFDEELFLELLNKKKNAKHF
ncbi:MAG: Gfo/Idh/MocA family oxidoreductase [Oscillospiraceae bacterium]|jgi:predicted dehydrogenase|nr:Gfo/Idh/MocA family oxidoreductase [Oscillospiraceae bacterium]